MMDALPCCRFPPLIFEVIRRSCPEPFTEPLIEDPPLDDDEEDGDDNWNGDENLDLQGHEREDD